MERRSILRTRTRHRKQIRRIDRRRQVADRRRLCRRQQAPRTVLRSLPRHAAMLSRPRAPAPMPRRPQPRPACGLEVCRARSCAAQALPPCFLPATRRSCPAAASQTRGPAPTAAPRSTAGMQTGCAPGDAASRNISTIAVMFALSGVRLPCRRYTRACTPATVYSPARLATFLYLSSLGPVPSGAPCGHST